LPKIGECLIKGVNLDQANSRVFEIDDDVKRTPTLTVLFHVTSGLGMLDGMHRLVSFLLTLSELTMATVRSLGWHILTAACLFVTTGCGDSHEAITVDTVRTLEEYAQILESVQDDASAEAAIPRVTAIGEQLASLKRRAASMGEAPKEIRDVIHEKYSKKLEAARVTVRETYAKMDPLYADQLADAIEGLEIAARQ
jgi:hypothetical protein